MEAPLFKMIPRCVLRTWAGLPDGMDIFKPKNPKLGKFWRVLQCKMLVYYITFGLIIRPFGIHILFDFDIICGNLVYFPRYGMLYGEKSGNHALESKLLIDDKASHSLSERFSSPSYCYHKELMAFVLYFAIEFLETVLPRLEPTTKIWHLVLALFKIRSD
jgi:hypothetical protein